MTTPEKRCASDTAIAHGAYRALEWAAKFPLGGGMDAVAAERIYALLSPLEDELRERSERQEVVAECGSTCGADPARIPTDAVTDEEVADAGRHLRSYGIDLEGMALAVRYTLEQFVKGRSPSAGRREDSARLDWLEGQVCTDVGINIYERLSPPAGVGLFCMATECAGDSLRDAIDGAMGSRAEGEGQSCPNCDYDEITQKIIAGDAYWYCPRCKDDWPVARRASSQPGDAK